MVHAGFYESLFSEHSRFYELVDGPEQGSIGIMLYFIPLFEQFFFISNLYEFFCKFFFVEKVSILLL